MSDFVVGLTLLVIVIAIITLVGHGIWVLLASLFRAVFSAGSDHPEKERRLLCPRCTTPWPPGGKACPICEWPGPLVAQYARQQAGARFRQQLTDWLRAGVVDDSTYRHLVEVLDCELAATTSAVPGVATSLAPSLPLHESTASRPDVVATTTERTVEPAGMSPFAVAPVEPPPVPTASPAPEEAMIQRTLERLRRTHAGDAQPAETPLIAAVVEPTSAPPDIPRQPPRAAFTAPSMTAAAPKRPFSELLVSFMEEKNIRWGELVGGLLIVCCSIALVISFWSEIAERPVLKFIVFNGVTASLFGAAFYTERRWRLPNTSRGLFIIAGLLVSLNFLAMAAFSRSSTVSPALSLTGEVVAVAMFSLLLWGAGRTLAPELSWLLPPGVMLPAIMQLLVRRYAQGAIAPTAVLWLAGIPAVTIIGVAAGIWRRARGWQPLTESHSNQMFRVLGLSAFAGLAAAGLLIAKAGPTARTMELIAPWMAVFGTAPLSLGLLLWDRLRHSELTGTRIAGTSIAVAGVMLMLLSVVFAWPQPLGMLSVLAVEAIVLVAVAWLLEFPAALLPAALCASGAYVLGYHALWGDLPWRLESVRVLLQQVLSAASGVALVASAAGCGLAAAWRMRAGGNEEARYLGLAAGLNAIASVALATWFGWDTPRDVYGVTWVYVTYGVGALAAARFARTAPLVWTSAALVMAALVRGVAFHLRSDWPLQVPWLLVLLIQATLYTSFSLFGGPRSRTGNDDWGVACARVAVASVSGATAWAIGAFAFENAGWVAVRLAWASAVWLALAWQLRARNLFAVFQGVATLAALGGVTGRLQLRTWYIESRHPLLDPWTLEAWGITLAAASTSWLALRAACRRLSIGENAPNAEAATASAWRMRLASLVVHNVVSVESAAGAAAIVLMVALAIYGALPGAAQELTPYHLAESLVGAKPTADFRVVPPLAAFEWLGVPHIHALGWGGSALLAAVAVMILAQMRTLTSGARVLFLLLVGGAGCTLIAGQFEGAVATASALRWLAALYLLAVSALLWSREPLARWLMRLGWPVESRPPRTFPVHVWLTLLGVALIPLIAMGLFVAGASVAQSPPEPALENLLFILLAVFAVAGVSGGLLPRIAGKRLASASWHTWAADLGRSLIVLGAAPLIVVAVYVVSSALSNNPIVGPEPTSIFARMGDTASYAAPLAIVALTLLGHAWRERSSAFALSAGLLLAAGATVGYLLWPWSQPLRLDAELWIKLAQLNAGVSAGFALAWLAVVARIHRGAAVPHDGYRATQATLGLAMMALVLVPGSCALWLDPRPNAAHLQLGEPVGWICLALAVASAVWDIRPAVGTLVETEVWESFTGAKRLLARLMVSPAIVSATLWTLGAMTAFSACHRDGGNWLAYHTLLASHVLAAILLWSLGMAARRAGVVSLEESQRLVPWLASFAALTVAVSWRAMDGDPARPWWTVGGMAAAGLISVAMATYAKRRRYLFAAAACLNVAANVAFEKCASPRDAAALVEYAWLNAVALALPVPLWVWLELRVMRPNRIERSQHWPFGVHRFATPLALLLLAATVGLGIGLDAVGRPFESQVVFGYVAMAAATVAALACLWDPAAKGGILTLYLLGLIGVGFAVDRLDMPPRWLSFIGAVVTAAYAVAASYLWSRREGLALLAKRLGIPVDAQQPWQGLLWLVPANCLLIVGVFTLAVGFVLTDDDVALRLAVAKAAWLQVVSLVLLARGERRQELHVAALVVGVIGGIVWGWAWLDPHAPIPLLDHCVIVMAMLSLGAVVYGLGLVKLLREGSAWVAAGQRLVPWCIAAAAISLVVILGGELLYYAQSDVVPMLAWGKMVVAVTLVGLFAAALAAAVVPGRDPMGLSERGRMAYVYAAEVVLAAEFLHIRLCLPWLFTGVFTRYWPLIVMAIAFVGVGLSEWFGRRRQRVLSEPLERSGALLPMLPVIGFWTIDSGTDYSLLLIVVGALYATLAVMRKSFGFGVLAALAANGGLWYFLHRVDGLGLLDHPQVWLIPPALCVLVAAYLNRERLTADQMTQIRYISALTIYVSSTADIFLNGMQEAPWLPLVLAGLSVLGVMAGILLRVRAFLYLGTTFLVLALVSMIWHAAHDLDQSWVWAASGIVAGMAIIALFALVEKKRQEVMHLVGLLREWEA